MRHWYIRSALKEVQNNYVICFEVVIICCNLRLIILLSYKKIIRREDVKINIIKIISVIIITKLKLNNIFFCLYTSIIYVQTNLQIINIIELFKYNFLIKKLKLTTIENNKAAMFPNPNFLYLPQLIWILN